MEDDNSDINDSMYQEQLYINESDNDEPTHDFRNKFNLTKQHENEDMNDHFDENNYDDKSHENIAIFNENMNNYRSLINNNVNRSRIENRGISYYNNLLDSGTNTFRCKYCPTYISIYRTSIKRHLFKKHGVRDDWKEHIEKVVNDLDLPNTNQEFNGNNVGTHSPILARETFNDYKAKDALGYQNIYSNDNHESHNSMSHNNMNENNYNGNTSLLPQSDNKFIKCPYCNFHIASIDDIAQLKQHLLELHNIPRESSSDNNSISNEFPHNVININSPLRFKSVTEIFNNISKINISAIGAPAKLNFKCPLCDFISEYKQSIKRHLDYRHHVRDHPQIQIPLNTSPKLYNFINNNGGKTIIQPPANEANPSYQILFSKANNAASQHDTASNTLTIGSKHINNASNAISTYQCDICEAFFISESAFTKHMQSLHPETNLATQQNSIFEDSSQNSQSCSINNNTNQQSLHNPVDSILIKGKNELFQYLKTHQNDKRLSDNDGSDYSSFFMQSKSIQNSTKFPVEIETSTMSPNSGTIKHSKLFEALMNKPSHLSTNYLLQNAKNVGNNSNDSRIKSSFTNTYKDNNTTPYQNTSKTSVDYVNKERIEPSDNATSEIKCNFCQYVTISLDALIQHQALKHRINSVDIKNVSVSLYTTTSTSSAITTVKSENNNGSHIGESVISNIQSNIPNNKTNQLNTYSCRFCHFSHRINQVVLDHESYNHSTTIQTKSNSQLDANSVGNLPLLKQYLQNDKPITLSSLQPTNTLQQQQSSPDNSTYKMIIYRCRFCQYCDRSQSAVKDHERSQHSATFSNAENESIIDLNGNPNNSNTNLNNVISSNAAHLNKLKLNFLGSMGQASLAQNVTIDRKSLNSFTINADGNISLAPSMDEENSTTESSNNEINLHSSYKCRYCPYSHHLQRIVLQHETNKHFKHLQDLLPGQKFVRCKDCNYIAPSKALLVKHRAEHDEGPMYCKHCDFSTFYSPNLERHLKRHSVRSIFKCNKCSYSSPSNQGIILHRDRHHNGRRSTTLPSSQTFRKSLVNTQTTNTTYNEDLDVITNDDDDLPNADDSEKFEEEQSSCVESLRQLPHPEGDSCSDTQLKIILKHPSTSAMSYRPILPNLTSNSTSSPSPLTIVESSPSRDNKHDTINNIRNKYLLSHNTSGAYPSRPVYKRVLPHEKDKHCTLCAYSTKWSCDLRLHYRNRHKVSQPYECQDCGQTFAYASDLRTHLKKAHGVDSRTALYEKVYSAFKTNPDSPTPSNSQNSFMNNDYYSHSSKNLPSHSYQLGTSYYHQTNDTIANNNIDILEDEDDLEEANMMEEAEMERLELQAEADTEDLEGTPDLRQLFAKYSGQELPTETGNSSLLDNQKVLNIGVIANKENGSCITTSPAIIGNVSVGRRTLRLKGNNPMVNKYSGGNLDSDIQQTAEDIKDNESMLNNAALAEDNMISTIDESLTTKGSQEILAFQRSCAQETDMTSPLLNSLINSQDTENSFEENGNFIGKRQTKMSLLAPKRDFGSCLTSAKRFKPSEETGFEPDYSADSNRASTPLKDNLNNSQVLDNHNPDKVDGFQNNSNSDSLSSFYYYYLNNSNNSHNNHHLINNADTSIDVRHISPNISIKNNSYLNPNNTYESYLNSILTPSALSSSAHSTPVASSASVSAKNSNMSRSASSKNVFGCAVCAYVSNCAAKIKLHVAVHASEKLYNCSECGKRSYWSWDISKHIKAKHPSHTSEDSMGIVNKPVPHIVKSIQALKEIEELNKLPIRVMKREDLMAGLHMGAGVPVNSNCEMGWGNDSSASYQGNNPQSGTTGGSQENASFGQNPNSAIHSTLPNTYTSYFNSPVLVFRCKFCSFKDPSRSLAESHVKSTHGYSIAPPKGPPADLLTLDSNAIMPVVDNYYERPAASFSTSLLSLTNPTSSYHSNQHPPQTTHQTGQSGGHGRRGAGVANSLTTTAAGNPRTNVYPCPVCPFISNKHSAFKRHTELHTFPPPRVDGNGVEAVTPHVGPYYKCPFCPYFVPLKRMLWQHLRMHVPNPQEILNRLSAYDPENDVRQPIPPNVDALSNTFAPNNRDNPNLTIADNSIVDQREDEAKDGDSKDFDLSNADGMNGSADDMAGNPTPKSEDFNHKNNEDVAEVATSICEAVACTREIKVEEESVCDDRSSDSIAKMTTTIISTNRRKSRAPSSLTSMLKAAAALSCPNPNPPIPLLPDCQMSAPTVLPDPIPITPSQPSLVITPQYVPPLPIMTPQYVPSSPITPLPLSPVITPQYVPPAPVITPQYVAPALVITPQYVQPTPVIIPQYVPPSPVTTPQYVPPHQAVENQTHISKFNDEIERNAPPSKPPKPCKWDKDDEKEITAAWGLKLGKYVRMFKCPYCPHLGTRRANVRLHIKLHGIREGMKGKLQKCPKCSFNCANPTRFSNHLNMHGIYADNRQTATDASRPPNTDFPSTDTGPNLGSSSQSRTQNNEIKSESDIQNCQASTVTDPVENVSSNSSPRLGLTNRPQDDFTQDGNILTSTPSNSDDKYDLKCPKCPAKFCLQRMFKKHMKFHGRKFKLHCQDCDYTCPKIYQLVRHVKLHNVTILPSSSSTLLPIFNARFPDSKIATSESLSVPVPQNSSNTQLPGTSPQISDRQIQSLRAKNLVVAIDLANSNKCFTSSIPKLELTPLCISDINNALDKPVISETEKGELTDQNSTPPLVNTFEKAFDYYHPDMARFLTIEHPSAKLNGPTTISYECQNCAFKSTSRCAIEKHCSFHVGKRDIFCQFCNYSARKKAPFEKHVEYHFDMQHNFFAKTNYFMKQEESLIDAIDGFDHSRAFKSNSGKRLPKHDPPNKRLDINGLTNNSDAKNMEVKSPLPEKNAPFCYCPHCGRNFENLTSETSQTNDSPKNPDGELSLLSHKTFHISACGYCFSLPSQPPSTQTADPNTSSSPAIPNSNDSKSSSNNERGDQNNNHCHNNHSKSDNNILSDKGGDGETDSPNFFYRYDSIGRRRKIFYSSTRIVSDGHSRSHSHNKHSFVGGSPGGNLLLNKVGGIQARVDVGSANIFSSFTSE